MPSVTNGERQTMRAYIYTRQSTEDQDTTEASQAQDCRQWAEARGYEIAGIYHDEISGSVPAIERDSFSSLLREITAGDTIISKRRDRLGRDVVDNAQAEREISRLGARFITTTGGDTSTAIGTVSSQIEDVFAGYERALIRERTRDALAELRRQGKPSGTPLLGTKIVYYVTLQNGEEITLGELAEDLDEKAKIELVRSWRANERLTFEQLRERCEQNGITSRRGSTPSIGTIRHWCAGIEKPKAKATTKTGPVPARRMEMRDENKGLAALASALRDKGLSYQKIAEQVSEAGYKTSTGGKLTKTQVMRILSK